MKNIKSAPELDLCSEFEALILDQLGCKCLNCKTAFYPADLLNPEYCSDGCKKGKKREVALQIEPLR